MRKKITIGNNESITLEEAFERFCKLKISTNVSSATLTYYKSCWKYFISYLNNDTKITMCNEINENIVIDYLMDIKESIQDGSRNLTDTSINTYLRGIRAILYNFMEKGYTRQFKINLIIAEKNLKETYTDLELEKLLAKPDAKKTGFSEYRNWVMICYFLGTGNRLSTVCNLAIKDIDFQSNEIMLKKVKNRKHYVIPLSVTLASVLQEYLEYRKGDPDDYLFCNQYGEQLTKDGLRSCIKKYNLSRGVDKSSIHLFRHTFAKKWILNKGDIFTLQKILGHSSMEIVKEYVNLYGSDLQRNFDTFSPLDNMNVKINKKKISL